MGRGGKAGSRSRAGRVATSWMGMHIPGDAEVKKPWLRMGWQLVAWSRRACGRVAQTGLSVLRGKGDTEPHCITHTHTFPHLKGISIEDQV